MGIFDWLIEVLGFGASYIRDLTVFKKHVNESWSSTRKYFKYLHHLNVEYHVHANCIWHISWMNSAWQWSNISDLHNVSWSQNVIWQQHFILVCSDRHLRWRFENSCCKCLDSNDFKIQIHYTLLCSSFNVCMTSYKHIWFMNVEIFAFILLCAVQSECRAEQSSKTASGNSGAHQSGK